MYACLGKVLTILFLLVGKIAFLCQFPSVSDILLLKHRQRVLVGSNMYPQYVLFFFCFFFRKHKHYCVVFHQII